MKFIVSILITLTTLNFCWAQNRSESLVEVTGQVFDRTNNQALPGISITVKNKKSGVMSNTKGMFSIVVEKGDVLEFTSLGFHKESLRVPQNINGKYYTHRQGMDMDTMYLNQVVIYNTMTPEEFDFAIKYEYEPNWELLALRENTGTDTRRELLKRMMKSASESQKMQQMNISNQYGTSYGQQYMSNIGSPRAWKEFINAWKNGDFRKK